jgi:hypothetical protein
MLKIAFESTLIVEDETKMLIYIDLLLHLLQQAQDEDLPRDINNMQS